MNTKLKTRLWAASLALPAVLVAGCSGGSSDNDSPDPVNVASTNLVALTSVNTLLSFNARTPNNTSTINVTGIPQGRNLVGIDYRYAPDSAAGQTGLYGIAGSGTTYQLYRLAINGSTATATAVGNTTFTVPINATDGIGFDFNPNVPVPPPPAVATSREDRIRFVSTSRTNVRLVPNTGAVVDNSPPPNGTPGVQLDGDLTYATGESSAIPRIVGAAYTNNDTDIATGTVNYALDAQTGNLVTQGRPNNPATPADEAVSPNTGQLFTVGSTGLTLNNGAGFDIAPTTNLGLVTNGNNLYTINLSSGSTTRLSNINVPTGVSLRGLAILPTSSN